MGSICFWRRKSAPVAYGPLQKALASIPQKTQIKPMSSLRAPQDVFNVSEITRAIKGVFENNFAQVWVRGEVTNCRVQSSGHVYFSLKDAEAQLSVVLFRSAAGRLRFPVRDGQQLVVFGRLDVYEPRGTYQLIAQAVLEDGVGRLQQEFERLKQSLEKEGLFAPERKKEIPRFPRTVGFVTSPTGAVIRDFLSILRRGGWTGRLVLLPALVQGEGAGGSIAAQIKHAQEVGIFDLLVVGRGGGSMEDLWAFNEEIVVRAVADCAIPVISAVGHQTDFTLCDFAADLRAETPSAAASLIVSHYADLIDELDGARESLARAEDDALESRAGELTLLTHRLGALHPGRFMDQASLRLDELEGRLRGIWQDAYRRLQGALDETALRFWRLDPAPKLATYEALLGQLALRLDACSIEGTLKRGFVLLADEEGGVISRAKQLKKGARIRARFHDGTARFDVAEAP